MTKSLKHLVEDLFDADYEEIASLSNFQEFEDWDSVMYISLVLAIEKNYDIKLKREEIQEILCIDGITRVLLQRQIRFGE